MTVASLDNVADNNVTMVGIGAIFNRVADEVLIYDNTLKSKEI